MFEREGDVRDFISERSDQVWWIEAAKGGSFGMPDCFAFWGGSVGWIEAKLAEVRSGTMVIEAAPAQLKAVRDLNKAGSAALFMAGLSGTSEVLLFRHDVLEPVAGDEKRVVYAVREWFKWQRFDVGGGPWAALDFVLA